MKYKLFTAAFLVLCLLPAAAMPLFGQTEAIGNERLSPAPRLRTDEGGLNAAVLDETTAYLADHFAFRPQMVTANAALRAGLLSSSPAADVIVGGDGMLYYAQTLPDYQNRATMTADEAAQTARLLADMQAYCESRGAAFLFTIAPNKNSLYPDAMPARYLQADAAGNYELLRPYLDEYGVRYADLFALFAAEDEVLYRKTDSHWTTRGAALAHDFLMETLGLPHTVFAGAENGTEQAAAGDLYAMLYPTGTARETQAAYAHAFVHTQEPLTDEDILIETTCAAAQNSGRLLFCRDSFGNALYPFLADDFAAATVTRAMPYPLEQVRAGDTVIVEIVERNLPNLLKYPPNLGNENGGAAV